MQKTVFFFLWNFFCSFLLPFFSSYHVQIRVFSVYFIYFMKFIVIFKRSNDVHMCAEIVTLQQLFSFIFAPFLLFISLLFHFFFFFSFIVIHWDISACFLLSSLIFFFLYFRTDRVLTFKHTTSPNDVDWDVLIQDLFFFYSENESGKEKNYNDVDFQCERNISIGVFLSFCSVCCLQKGMRKNRELITIKIVFLLSITWKIKSVRRKKVFVSVSMCWMFEWCKMRWSHNTTQARTTITDKSRKDVKDKQIKKVQKEIW